MRLLYLLGHCGWMLLGSQQEARHAQAASLEFFRALTDGHWMAQAVGLEALLALAAGPSGSPLAALLAVAGVGQVQ